MSSVSTKTSSEKGDQANLYQQYSNIEKAMLKRDQFEDEEEYQRMRAIRRAIRKKNKQQNKNKNESEQRVVAFKDVRANDVKLFYNIDSIQKLFLIHGDYFVMLDYNEKIKSIEEQINFFKSIKYVLSAEKQDKKGMVYLNILTKDYIQHTPLEVIQHMVSSRSQDQLLQFFSPYISQYYQNLEFNKQLLSKINKVYTQEQQYLIREKRNEYFDQKMNEYIENNFTELDFFMYYKYSQANINDPYLQYTKVCVSYPLIALLGTDPDTFINISMRNGFMEFSTKSNKQDQIIRSMICQMNLNHTKEITDIQSNITLLTFDEFEIHTTVLTHCFILEYPPELQIEVDGQSLVYETPHFLSYQIDQNAIQTILAKRKRDPQFLQQWENEEFGYTLESQIFLEKHYKDIIDHQISFKQQKYLHQLKYYYNKECRYKQILSDTSTPIKPQQSYQDYQNQFISQ